MASVHVGKIKGKALYFIIRQISGKENPSSILDIKQILIFCINDTCDWLIFRFDLQAKFWHYQKYVFKLNVPIM